MRPPGRRHSVCPSLCLVSLRLGGWRELDEESMMKPWEASDGTGRDWAAIKRAAVVRHACPCQRIDAPDRYILW
jgi:hypothetical protein